MGKSVKPRCRGRSRDGSSRGRLGPIFLPPLAQAAKSLSPSTHHNTADVMVCVRTGRRARTRSYERQTRMDVTPAELAATAARQGMGAM